MIPFGSTGPNANRTPVVISAWSWVGDILFVVLFAVAGAGMMVIVSGALR